MNLCESANTRRSDMSVARGGTRDCAFETMWRRGNGNSGKEGSRAWTRD